MMDIEVWLSKWLDRRWHKRAAERFGAVQQCPWCKQCAQRGDGWKFEPFEGPEAFDPFLDRLTCGVCGGTSLWHFAMGMIYIRPDQPPLPLISTAFKGPQ